MRFAMAAAAALALLSSCGYHTGGRGDLLPKTLRTIAIPPFANSTTRYKITDLLPEAITREFISRTRYKIITDPDAADAVLRGTVTNYVAAATVFDPTTGRASAVDIHVVLQLSLVERVTGKVLYSRPYMDVRERYQISVDPGAFFEESDAAIARASVQTARQVVSAILESF
ncbi:MAG TPA: LPS assembly lipoprotein LptE [Bryobacteraceae bacterium]|nr:LPS assembly lipoprotein LptE [Bryobacteraceae bacterium]